MKYTKILTRFSNMYQVLTMYPIPSQAQEYSSVKQRPAFLSLHFGGILTVIVL